MKALRRLDQIVEGAAVAIFAASSLLIIINVINRYLVLGALRSWSRAYEDFTPVYLFFREIFGAVSVTADEVPGLLLVWVAFLGAYLAMRRDGHIAFDLIARLAGRRWRRALALVSSGLIVGFLCLLLWQSMRMIRVSGRTEIETAEMAQGWFMAILPIAALLLLIAVLYRLAEQLKDN